LTKIKIKIKIIPKRKQQRLEIYAHFVTQFTFRIKKKQVHSGNKLKQTLPLQLLLTDELLTLRV
jgi:hypothetical protein